MIELHTTQEGEGELLIMLHGLFGSVDNFGVAARELQNQFCVIRADLPGHGRSPTLPSLSLESMADAVLEMLEHKGIKRFHLLGHSLGGKVAMSMAANPRCKGLQKLIVVDIAPKDYPPHHQDILEALQAIDLETITSRAAAAKLLSSVVKDTGVRSFLLKSLYKDKESGFAWRFDLQQLSADYPLIAKSPLLRQLVVQPTLFIKGGNSDYLQATDESIIRQAFASPSVKVIMGAGHWPHAEKPEQFVRICEQFLTTSLTH